ncbi:MAG TPA: YcjX family protein, partial [Planctomycetaceae bacterium]|nr:YcjX family protein [Planctomycetaceae bacterium]
MFNPFQRHPFQRSKTVGVTGLVRSGKTVLLTSLLAHLRNHSPQRLALGRNGTRVTEVRELPLGKHATRFDAVGYRNCLASNRFPPKTLATHEYRAEYVRSDWKYTRLDLRLVEVPGELLADLVIAEHPRFEDWSETVLRALQRTEFSAQAADFLSALESAEANGTLLDDATLRTAYQTALARMVVSYMPVVTPSSFLPRGESVSGIGSDATPAQKIDYLVTHQICGLDRDSQFFPLPAPLRTARPELVRMLSAHYAAYRRQVVLPMARRLRRCDELLVLVDVAMLLEGGAGMLNANALFLEQLLQSIDPGFRPPAASINGLFRALGGPVPFAGVRRIVFVATKADRVHPHDRNRLRLLLQDLIQPLIGRYHATRQLDVEYLLCAAVNCTRCPDPERRVLQIHWAGTRGPNGTPRDVVEAEVSEVPEEWPGSYAAGDYHFASPDPWMPETLVRLPEHID